MCPSLGLGVTAGMLYLDAAIQGCCPYEARNGGWEEGPAPPVYPLSPLPGSHPNLGSSHPFLPKKVNIFLQPVDICRAS